MKVYIQHDGKIPKNLDKNIIDDITIQSKIEKKLFDQLLERSKQFNSYYN